ncbi:lactonase family protein [Herbidospora galbida]|uniref:Lactonase family protein n=1 Tax=Herbidospora galbida TaxID=2575442 RepID=A0A4U3M9C9_9ACTN|nr:beta-propeller fold lactonase family protein [Herbidospora galbida]TKK84869.1 lactonase family protein [Herbidospora galbida]
MSTVYIGGYTSDTGGAGAGVTVAARAETGALTEVGTAAASGPSFLAAHPTLPILYAVGEADPGTITAFGADGPDGPERLATRSSGGDSPCHVAVADRWLAVANYGDGMVALHALDDEGLFTGPPLLFPGFGSGPDSDRQRGPHAHQATFEAGVLYVTDLGADQIRQWRVRAEVTELEPLVLTPGTGPRHLVSARTGWFVTGELDGQVHAFDPKWHPIGQFAASGRDSANYPSHIQLHRDRLYVANRGPNTISVFDPETFKMVAEVDCGGDWPRHFAIEGDDLYVANQRSGGVVHFRLAGGVPEPTGHVLAVPTPTCVLL